MSSQDQPPPSLEVSKRFNTRELTCLPSTTPFGLGLGPNSPSVDEPNQPYPGLTPGYPKPIQAVRMPGGIPGRLVGDHTHHPAELALLGLTGLGCRYGTRFTTASADGSVATWRLEEGSLGAAGKAGPTEVHACFQTRADDVTPIGGTTRCQNPHPPRAVDAQ